MLKKEKISRIGDVIAARALRRRAGGDFRKAPPARPEENKITFLIKNFSTPRPPRPRGAREKRNEWKVAVVRSGGSF
ncbi:hypothetical protein EVAR_32706_1 [Eumeta japonica]|uniref:Uncharacterized protein n=1 Tax=Eumeta variegata TaxID=151549 RepID=A0A4C1VPS6_EUMVA|nr:hypothetical protein EVAR_32706_1 [Eumeta japonica]